MAVMTLPSVPAAGVSFEPDSPAQDTIQPREGLAAGPIRLILEALGFLVLAGSPVLLLAVGGMHFLVLLPLVLLSLLVTGNLALGAIAYRGASLLISLPANRRVWIAYGCAVAALAVHFIWTKAMVDSLQEPARLMAGIFGGLQVYLLLLGLPGFVIGWKQGHARQRPETGAPSTVAPSKRLRNLAWWIAGAGAAWPLLSLGGLLDSEHYSCSIVIPCSTDPLYMGNGDMVRGAAVGVSLAVLGALVASASHLAMQGQLRKLSRRPRTWAWIGTTLATLATMILATWFSIPPPEPGGCKAYTNCSEGDVEWDRAEQLLNNRRNGVLAFVALAAVAAGAMVATLLLASYVALRAVHAQAPER